MISDIEKTDSCFRNLNSPSTTWLVGVLILSIIYMLMPQRLRGQILNADRILQGDTGISRQVVYSFGLSAAIDRQNRNLWNTMALSDLSCRLNNQKNLMLLLASMDLILNGKDIIQNTGFAHIRFRDNDQRRIYPEPFIQVQWNGALGMQLRYLIGSNMRWLLAKDEKMNICTGLGLFQEWERWDLRGVPAADLNGLSGERSVRRLRANHYFKATVVLGDVSDIVIQEFVQSNIAQWNQIRFSLQASVQIRAGKHLAFLIGYDGMYDTKPVVPISKYLFGFNTELRLNF